MAKPPPRPRYRRARTPTVLQMEATECGAAALGIVLAYHGRYVPLEELRVECHVSRDGTNLYYMKEAGRRYHLVGRAYRRAPEGLREVRPPFVVHWEANHFLVVEGFGRGRVYLNDPASGRRVVDDAEFARGYSGRVIVYEPTADFRRGGERPNTWRAVFRRMRGARAAVLYVVLAGAALTACELVVAAYNLIFVDQVLVAERRHWVRPLILAVGLTAAVRAVAGVVQLGALRRLRLSLAMVHSARFLGHVLHLPLSFYQQRFAGEVASRVDASTLAADLIAGPLATTAVGLLMVVVYAALMAAADPWLALVGVAIGVLNLAGIAAADRLLTDQNLTIKQVRGKLQTAMTRAVQAIETVKAGAMEPDALVRLAGHQTRVTNASQRVGAAGALMVALPPLLLTLSTAAVLWAGGRRVIEGVMGVGALLAFQTLMAHFNRPFGDLVRLGSSVQSLQAELSRLDDVFQYPPDPVFAAPPADPAAPGREPPRRLSGRLEFRGVTFGYRHTVEEPLIEGFSLDVTPGSRVALVGASGSGKSTIGRLAAGLYRPWKGAVLYDGRTIDEIPRGVFTSQVALVDDQAFLFRGTIRDNLTLWDETVLDRELTRAATDAHVHLEVLRRRGGYGARLAEGARNLSGGQRQRLEIARALVRNPALLVLDEATSALDPDSEARVDDNLRRRGCTCLIIAHRLSTIRDCDQILVLRQGRVVQRGTHEQLMADAGGFYHELYSLQDPPRRRGARVAVPAGPFSANGRGTAGAAGAGLRECPLARPATERPSLARALRPFGETATTAGNHPLPLDDADAVWRVEEGRVDVFYLQPEPGQASTSRWHLCRVGEGDSVFALGGVRGEREGGLLAVGVGPARLRKFPRAELQRLGRDPALRHEVAEMVDGWVDLISRIDEAFEPPAGSARLDPGTPCRLDAGQPATARSAVVWVRDGGAEGEGEGGAGRARYVGRVRVPPGAAGGRLPLSRHAWLAPGAGGELDPCATEDLLASGDVWGGLARFHRVTLDAIALARGLQRAVRHAQLESAALHDEGRVADALAGLARAAAATAPGVGADAAAAARSAADALLDACRAVGEAAGIEVKAPPPDATGEPLRRIARASGFRTRRVRLGPGWRGADGGALLGTLTAGARPVALLPGPGGGYVLVDPGRGSRTPVTDEVAAGLAPSAVVFYRCLPPAPQGAADLVRLAAPAVRGELWAVLALGLLAGLLGLAAPVVVGVVVDDVVPRADRGQLGLLCGLLVAVGLAAASLQAVQGVALVRIRGRLESGLLPAVWDRLLGLPARFFAGYESGDLAHRAMGLARMIEALTGTAVTSLAVGLSSLLNLLFLFAVNWRLALAALGLVAVLPLAHLVALPALWGLRRSVARSQGEISGLLLALLGGIGRLRTAGAERRAFARWAEAYRRQVALANRAQAVTDVLTLVGDVWPLVVLMGVFAAAVGLGPGAFGAGEFLAFSVALALAVAAVTGIAKGVPTLLHAVEQYERARPILEAVPETADARGGPVALRGAIRLDNVSFRYEPDGPPILDSVSLQALPGEFVAVVGPSGAGKSTLLRLLLGFEAPTEGEVRYDNRLLFTLDVHEFRRQVGVVLQDAQLFPGDIYSNIVGLSNQFTEADAHHAARLAGLADDLAGMPMGLSTAVGEGGSGLSSGQRQRLIIARALVARPRVLLLDEATSALDNRSQALIGRNLRSALRDTTCLAIAHRLSTVVDADRIYVLKDGRIVQNGTYAQLMDEDGVFRDLATRQLT